jgi:hypothetical protein
LTALEMRAPRNVLMVAMAKKLARIAWVVLSTRRISGPSRYGSRNHKFSHQGLHRASKDERTVTSACLKRVCRMDLK